MSLENLEHLKEGHQYTLMGFTDFGFPYSQKIILKGKEISEYAQYRESIKLTFVKKGGRTLLSLRIHGIKKILVFPGWINLDVEMFRKEEEFNGMKVKKSLLCFDREYFNIAKKSVEAEGIIPIELCLNNN